MKISQCHQAQMQRHSVNGNWICCVCGYASPYKEQETKEVRKRLKKDGRQLITKKIAAQRFQNSANSLF